MPTEPITETRFALEGFLPLWIIIALGLALLGLSWWSALRDRRHADKPRWVWFLFSLRCIAILVLLWMLAGPTLVQIVKTFRTQTVAILVDRSGSMGLVDVPDGSGNVSRWAAARDVTRDAREVRSFDEAASRLRAAQKSLEQLAGVPDSTSDTDKPRAMLAQAVRGLSEGIARLRATSAALAQLPPELQRGITDATRILESEVLEPLNETSSKFKPGRTLASLEREQWLVERLTRLSMIVEEVDRIADEYARSLDQALIQTPGTLNPQESKLSRFDKVESFLVEAEEGWLKDIRRKATVTRYEFGDKVVPLGSGVWKRDENTAPSPSRAGAAATHLGAALQQVALDRTAQPVEAAILFTDGGQNAGRDPRELAPALAGTRLHIVPIGNTKIQRDVILHHTHAPKVVLQNDQVVVDAIVTAYDCAQEKLRVELMKGDEVIDQKEFEVGGEVLDSRVQLRWDARQLGKHTLAIRVVPVRDERTEENNATKLDLQVMEDEIRVLVADNFPRWETRYLINLFRRDERVIFDQLLFEPQRTSGQGLRTSLPNTPQEWSKYRVIILGDLLPAQLTPEHQKQLRDYVTEGGGNLILIAGRDAMPAAYADQPLGAILPVEPGAAALPDNSPYYLHLTDEGSMTIATQIADSPDLSERAWREMSHRIPVYGLSEFSKPKPATHSLIWASTSKTTFNPSESSTRSFLAWHYVGAGRVVYLAAPVVYQLRYRQGDGFHHRFWGQLLRWAVARDMAEGSQTVRLSTDKTRYEQGEPVQVSVRLRQPDGRSVAGAAIQVAASQEGNVIQELALVEDSGRPGSYLGVLKQLPTGPVRLEILGPQVKSLLAAEDYNRPVETTIHLDPSGQLELRHPLCNLPLLQEIADASGGMVVPPTGLKAALDQLNLEPEVIENSSRMPLWNRWDLFWIFIVCLTLEWAGRKYVGLS